MLRADGCLLCIALEAVEGVFEDEPDRVASWPVVDWATVSGLADAGAERSESSQLVLVRTGASHVALRVEACLGVRSISLLDHPPVPTYLTDPHGHPLCYLLNLDRRVHFLVEPGALARAADRERHPAGSSNGAGHSPEAVGS
ncbi:MAG: hypothetical protein FJ144_16270 [Deltaproteobacteria bacterium]|nr:hypothetical protein [Deltaproteobacteria bacterium]